MVQVVRKETLSSEETENHSLTGLFLKCNYPEHYNIDDQVDVSFKDETGATQTHTGQVVRKSQNGIAIQYQKESNKFL